MAETDTVKTDSDSDVTSTHGRINVHNLAEDVGFEPILKSYELFGQDVRMILTSSTQLLVRAVIVPTDRVVDL